MLGTCSGLNKRVTPVPVGMWYLWVCSCSLPALVQLTEREEQAESLARLRRLLQQEAGQREMYGNDVTHYMR